MKLKVNRTIDGIILSEPHDVYPVMDVSRLLVKKMACENPGTALDMGTGTGYIGIYLAKHGFDVMVSDINPEALSIAHDNAGRNNVSLQAVESDLFENIPSKFDYIVFAMPNFIGGGRMMKFAQFLVAKLLHDTLGAYYEKWDYRLFAKKSHELRKGLVKALMEGSPSHLNENGRVYLLVFEIDLDNLIKPMCEALPLKIIEIDLINPANRYYIVVLEKEENRE
jgi:methylase of polypeptide subunit release factors